MKRTAAILGPTPPFVRWAIRFDCKLRDNTLSNLPDTTFRQLRSIRELSMGYRQSRVIDGVCLHADQTVESSEALGFLADEVTAVFGGATIVDHCCRNCPANAVNQLLDTQNDSGPDFPVWAGCYGWLPAVDSGVEYLTCLDRLAESSPDLFTAICPTTTPAWYGVWQTTDWHGDKLHALNELIAALLDCSKCARNDKGNLLQLHSAVRGCLTNQLHLATESLPRGHSNGTTWRIFQHCSVCKFELDNNASVCPACGRRNTTHPETRRKVLGIRPYVKLERIIGPAKTQELLNESETREPGAR